MSSKLFFEQRQAELALLVEETERGGAQALTLYAECKELEKMYKAVATQLEPLAQMEAETYAEREFLFDGFEFEKKNGATRFDYKGIEEWQKANAKLKAIEARAKQAYLAKQKGVLSATEDGEEIELPQVNYSKNSLIARRPKNFSATH